MTDDQNEHTPGDGAFESGGVERPGMSPPVEQTAGFDEDASRSSWPTAIGILGIILAAFGFLGTFCGLALPLILPRFESSMPPEQYEQAMASMPPMLWMVTASAVGLVMSTLLLLGSISLLRRRAKGVGLLKVWSFIQIPWSMVSFAINLVLQPEAAQAQGQQLGGLQSIFMGLGICMGIVVGFGVPIFLLIWFSRGKIKQEIADWDNIERDYI